MTTNQFTQAVLRTEASDFIGMSTRLIKADTIRLLHAGMGLCTESSEFLDAIKKHVFYGKPLDTVNLREELGDTLYYLQLACIVLGTDIPTEMERVSAKLEKRYPDKFTTENAINRNLDAERKVLEA